MNPAPPVMRSVGIASCWIRSLMSLRDCIQCLRMIEATNPVIENRHGFSLPDIVCIGRNRMNQFGYKEPVDWLTDFNSHQQQYNNQTSRPAKWRGESIGWRWVWCVFTFSRWGCANHQTRTQNGGQRRQISTWKPQVEKFALLQDWHPPYQFIQATMDATFPSINLLIVGLALHQRKTWSAKRPLSWPFIEWNWGKWIA